MRLLQPTLVLFLLCSFVACSDESPTDNDPDDNNNSTEYANEVTATLNGTEWSAVNIMATRNAAAGIVAVTCAAFGPNGSQVTFGIAFASEKEHVIDDQSVHGEFNTGEKRYDESDQGTITITNLTTEGMRGTFNITAETSDGEAGTAVGSFDVKF